MQRFQVVRLSSVYELADKDQRTTPPSQPLCAGALSGGHPGVELGGAGSNQRLREVSVDETLVFWAQCGRCYVLGWECNCLVDVWPGIISHNRTGRL